MRWVRRLFQRAAKPVVKRVVTSFASAEELCDALKQEFPSLIADRQAVVEKLGLTLKSHPDYAMPLGNNFLPYLFDIMQGYAEDLESVPDTFFDNIATSVSEEMFSDYTRNLYISGKGPRSEADFNLACELIEKLIQRRPKLAHVCEKEIMTIIARQNSWLHPKTFLRTFLTASPPISKSSISEMVAWAIVVRKRPKDTSAIAEIFAQITFTKPELETPLRDALDRYPANKYVDEFRKTYLNSLTPTRRARSVLPTSNLG